MEGKEEGGEGEGEREEGGDGGGEREGVITVSKCPHTIMYLKPATFLTDGKLTLIKCEVLRDCR